MEPELRKYSEVRHLIRDAGLLEFYSRTRFTLPIEILTDSPFVHCAMSCRCHGRILALQTTAFGDKKPLLSEQVKRYPGCIVYYEPSPTVSSNIEPIIDKMLDITCLPYGWQSLLRIAAQKLKIIGPNTDDTYKADYLPCCSHALAMSYRESNIDPVPGKANCFTTPADLARSKLFKPKYILTP